MFEAVHEHVKKLKRSAHRAFGHAHRAVAVHHTYKEHNPDSKTASHSAEFHKEAAQYHHEQAEWHSKNSRDPLSEKYNEVGSNQATANMAGTAPNFGAI